MRGTLLLVSGTVIAAVLIAAPQDESTKPAAKDAPPAPGRRVEGPEAPPRPATPPPAAAGAPIGPGDRPAEEVRAVWITRWDFKTEADVRKLIAGCAALGFNRVVFQVRGVADAFYRSSLEPWGEDLDGPLERGGDPGFDPLQVAVEEAHRRGVALHAWANVLPGWKGTTPPRSPNHLVHLHPEWFLPDRSGRPRPLEREHYAMLNPALAAVRAHLARVLGDIAERYPVDGIQLDYIRYLARDELREQKPASKRGKALLAAGTETLPVAKSDPDQVRQKAMELLVSEISKAVRRRPGLRLSMAAIRDTARARSALFQDAEGWMRRGWIDEAFPMNYVLDSDQFEECTRRWVKACGRESVVMGIGVHLLDGARGLREQLQILRGQAAVERPAGYCLFACSEFLNTASPESRSDPAAMARKAQLRAFLLALQRPAAAAGAKAADPSPAPRPANAPPKAESAPAGKTR